MIISKYTIRNIWIEISIWKIIWLKMMIGILIKCLNIGGQYYLQTRMLSNEDNAEKTISGNSI
mgnify:CR=1 FL=1